MRHRRPIPPWLLRVVPVAGAVALAASGAAAQPANDLCVNGVTLSLGTVARGSNLGAGFELNMSFQPCALVQSGAMPADVWYRFTAPADGVYEVQTRGDGGIPTFITVPWFEEIDNVCPDPTIHANAIRLCVSDSGAGAASGRLRLRAGQFIAFSVATTPGTSGEFDVEVRAVPDAPAAPANDLCSAAAALTVGAPLAGTNLHAGPEMGQVCSGSVDLTDPTGEVWYTFAVPSTGLYRFSVQGAAGMSPALVITTACPQALIAQWLVACVGDPFGLGFVEVHRQLTAGDNYRIAVGSSAGMSGAFSLQADLVATTPSNDECAAAEPIALGHEISGSNLAATGGPLFDSGAPCGSLSRLSAGASDVFFVFVPPEDRAYSFSTCESDSLLSPLDTVISLHTGCPATGANLIACNDDQPRIEAGGGCNPNDVLGGASSRVPGVVLAAGVPVYVRVAGKGTLDLTDFQTIASGQQGTFKLRVEPDAPRQNPPANDACANAAPIEPGMVLAGSTVYSSGGAWSCLPFGGDESFDVWYRLTSSVPGRNTFTIRLTLPLTVPQFGGPPRLAVHDDCGAAARYCTLNVLDSSRREVAVALENAQSVLIRVGGMDAPGDFEISVTNVEPTPPETTCDAPLTPALTAGGGMTGSTLGLPDALPHPCVESAVSRMQWHTFTAPEDAFYVVSMSDTLVDGQESSGTMLVLPGCGDAPVYCGSTFIPCFGCPPQPPRATLRMTAGQQVRIGAGLTGLVSGTYTLNASAPIPVPAPPSNDLCANATVVSVGAGQFFTESIPMTGATVDLNGAQTPCQPLFPSGDPLRFGPGAWYSVTPAVAGKLFVYAARVGGFGGFSEIPQVTVFTGDCAAPEFAACHTLGSGIDGDPPVLEAGRRYLILVYYIAGTSLDLDNLTEVRIGVEPPPSNDACTTAQSVASVPAILSVNNWGAMDDPQPSSCSSIPGAATMANVVWYRLRTSSAGTITLTVNSGIGAGRYYDLLADTFVTIYDGSCSALDELKCDCTYCTLGAAGSAFTAQAGLLAGREYFIALGARRFAGSEAGDLELRVEYDGGLAAACLADFNNSGQVTIDDIFVYLNAWFGGDPRADADGSGGVTISDIFVFLNAWFAGCQ